MTTREWLIERVRLGERSLAELTPAERKRLEALAAEDANILAQQPPAAVAEEVARRARVESVRSRTRRRTGALLLAPALAGAAGLLLTWEDSPTRPDRLGPERVRLKGQSILLHRKAGESAEPLKTGSLAQAGDRLQLGFRLDAPRHLVLLSIDGAGVVTLHLPEHGDRPNERPAGTSFAPFSYELDDAPGFERFFLVTSDAPFSVAEVVTAAEDRARAGDADRVPLALSPGLNQLDVLLQKAAPR